jgi:formate dehydrogenase subunit gamma
MQAMANQDKIVTQAIGEHRHMAGALLPILHAIQDRLGYVPPKAIPTIARELNLSRADVHGVVSFYHHFRSHPAGKHVVRICRAEACQSMGAERLMAHAQATLGSKPGANSPNGRFTLESVYCLGNCACSPAVMVNDDIHGRVTPERFDAIIRNLGDQR